MTTTDRLYETEHLEGLLQRARDEAPGYASADPFPHAVLDDFLPEAIVEQLAAEFPEPGSLEWRSYDSANERKLAHDRVEELPATIRDTLFFMNSSPFLQFLEALTGIEGLIADSHFRGGGIHQIVRGGMLGVHTDFNKHKTLKLDRRLNALLFLNADWEEAYGGHLELWNAKTRECVRRVLPVFNRCVVFSTTDWSLHGHPEPLTCPEGRSRRSIATYYYTNGRPSHEVSGKHTTIFTDGEVAPRRRNLRRTLREMMPDALRDRLRSLRGQ